MGATKASLLKYVKKSGNLSRVYLRKAFWLFTLITDETEEDFQVTYGVTKFKYSKGHKFLDINMFFTYYEQTTIV